MHNAFLQYGFSDAKKVYSVAKHFPTGFLMLKKYILVAEDFLTLSTLIRPLFHVISPMFNETGSCTERIHHICYIHKVFLQCDFANV